MIPPQCPYRLTSQGVYARETPVVHRESEFDPLEIDILFDMQERHFWYRGRHRFLEQAFRRHTRARLCADERLQGLDLGGGSGGWIAWLAQRCPQVFSELAIADS